MEEKINQIWKNKILRYLFVFIGSAFADFLISLYTYAISNGWITTQAVVGFLIPFVNFTFSIWFIETKDLSERFKLTFVSALGMIVGSTITLLLVK